MRVWVCPGVGGCAQPRACVCGRACAGGRAGGRARGREQIHGRMSATVDCDLGFVCMRHSVRADKCFHVYRPCSPALTPLLASTRHTAALRPPICPDIPPPNPPAPAPSLLSMLYLRPFSEHRSAPRGPGPDCRPVGVAGQIGQPCAHCAHAHTGRRTAGPARPARTVRGGCGRQAAAVRAVSAGGGGGKIARPGPARPGDGHTWLPARARIRGEKRTRGVRRTGWAAGPGAATTRRGGSSRGLNGPAFTDPARRPRRIRSGRPPLWRGCHGGLAGAASARATRASDSASRAATRGGSRAGVRWMASAAWLKWAPEWASRPGAKRSGTIVAA